MNGFIWTMIVLLAIESVGKLACLAKNEFPQRTPVIVAWEIAINVVLLIWAFCILF